MKKSNATDKSFYRGYAIALAQLIREHDKPTMAIDMAKCYGITLADLEAADLDVFDMKPIRKAFKENA